MSRLEETRAIRLQKIAQLRQRGIDPYPVSTQRTHPVSQIQSEFGRLLAAGTIVCLAGRIRSIRRHGALAFIDLDDGTGSFQLFVKKDVVGQESFQTFIDLIDPGDIAQFTGPCFLTKQNTPSLEVKEYTLLAKALRAIPETHYGLKDVETRLRRRYLDLAANPERRQIFVQKAAFWKSIRNFLETRDFLEVQTPALEHIPGGADAEPFTTHHHALDQDFFLRVSLELPLKRLLVGGFEKVFEIGRIFRNEGISAEHLQDYTQMECYWAYADFDGLQHFLIDLYRVIIRETCGSLICTHAGETLDWGSPWQRYDYTELFHQHVGLDLKHVAIAELKSKADALKLSYDQQSGQGRLIDLLYKKMVRPHLIQPGFLIHPPVEVEPLAKRLPDDPSRVLRLQVVAWGTELGKGFSELNDPVDQRARFEEQMKLRQAGDREAQQLDEDYIEALEYGLPPTAGFGLSERLFAVLMDLPIRETTLFPPMKNTT